MLASPLNSPWRMRNFLLTLGRPQGNLKVTFLREFISIALPSSEEVSQAIQ
jgi:hypothetical protein